MRIPDPDRMLRRPRFPRRSAPAWIVVVAIAAFALGRMSAVDRPASSQGSPTRARKPVPAALAGTALVLDGDTIDFDGVRVRLFGIDAPERDQLCEGSDASRYACGQTAREALAKAISGEQVSCTRRDVDRYGRMVGVCSTRDGDIAAMLVEQGLALAYRHFSNDYVDEEDRARAARRGLWQGRFDAPWRYRDSRRRR